MKIYHHIIITCSLSSCLGLFSQDQTSDSVSLRDREVMMDSIELRSTLKKIEFDGSDGPYIINDTLYRVTAKDKFVKEVGYKKDSILIEVDNKSADRFSVSLASDHEIPNSSYPLPKKLIVISDIEGNYNAFASFLTQYRIIDKNHNWTFDEGHLVLLGDFVDRGKNVTQVLWLIYKLEQQAEANNGQVHFILGNHEVLNFQGDYRYNQGKYIRVAQEISGLEDKTEALKFLYSKKSELGRWLATKNVAEQIGDYLFVHGGLHPNLLDYKLTLDKVNVTIRANYYKTKTEDDKISSFLYSGKGPFWYRGLVTDRPNYNKIKDSSLEELLSYYAVKKIVVGHTPVEDISADYHGKVIRMDVVHGFEKFSKKTKGLLIEKNQEYVIDAMGNKKELHSN